MIHALSHNASQQLLEMALPIGFLALLLAIKIAAEGGASFEPTIEEATFPDESDVIIPMTFQDYVVALQVERRCTYNALLGRFDITGMPYQGIEWQVPMLKCDPRRCTEEGQDATDFCEMSILGIAGGADELSQQRAVSFKEYIEATYPALIDREKIPSNFDLIRMFDTSEELSDYVRGADYEESDVPKLAMGIVWDSADGSSAYNYQLRQNSTNFNNPVDEARPAVRTSPETRVNFEKYAKTDEVCYFTSEEGGPEQGHLGLSCTGQYVYNGVLTFQRLVHDFILEDSGAAALGYKVAEAGVGFVPFPTPEYEEEGFFGAIAAFSPLLITLGLLYPVASMISYVTKEKELRQKELLKMMSVTESDIGWAWFMSFFVFNVITATLTSVVASRIYENSEPLIMWFFWVFTFTAITTFTLALSSLTSRATRGVLLGLLFFFGGYVLSVAIDYTTSSMAPLLALHPVVAFSYGLFEISRLEDLGIGLTADSISESDNVSGYTFGNALNALFTDAILWGVLSWYLNRVIPPEYGQALPVWFPFMPSYWLPSSSKVAGEDDIEDQDAEHVPLEPVGDTLEKQTELGQNIVIKSLSKVFGDKVAVDKLNLTFYRDQITALLGHNGT